MLVFNEPKELQKWALAKRAEGTTIALVPTMGYLHEGHLSLIAEAKKHARLVVVSIFVNPVQFGPNEDFDKYPRDEKRDMKRCEEAGAAAVFLPTPRNMYAKDASVYVVEEQLGKSLCGARRPGHFRGVCTVVSKLFNLAQPNFAVFGQKDYQQAMIIRRMVRDLNFPLEIIVAPLIREPDGLARSSRNVYLSAEERGHALGLSQSLKLACEIVAKGPIPTRDLRTQMIGVLERSALKVDYVEIVEQETLIPVAEAKKGCVALVAAYSGKTRLIDNMIL